MHLGSNGLSIDNLVHVSLHARIAQLGRPDSSVGSSVGSAFGF